MTKVATCRWCGVAIVRDDTGGRPRQYCRQSCRQQAYLARKLAAAHDLADGEVVVRCSDLEDLQDKISTLHAALEDVAGDLATATGPHDVRQALDWLVSQARPLADVWMTPVANRLPLGAPLSSRGYR